MANAPSEVPKHFLNPCTIFVHREEHFVTTVLGSCVSVCLWDAGSGVGGMNHYMLPLWNGEGLPTPKYGNVAIERLLLKMLELGCRRDRLIAKVFGGANVLGSGQGFYQVGKRNTMLCEELLARMGIQITGSDLGGDRGRRVVFNTRTGLVRIARLSDISRRPEAP